MKTTDLLSFSLKKKLPLLLQDELSECGLACIGMIANFFGARIDLPSLRQKFSISAKGVTLADIVQMAQQLGLQARPLKVELESLQHLRLPCILHWNFNHFVVLKAVKGKQLIIHDPAIGVRNLSFSEASPSVTGVALELWPGDTFQAIRAIQSISFQQLFGKVTGLSRSLAQVVILAGCLELFAMSAPLFLQWVFDKVVLSADYNLLFTMALGFWLLMLFQHGTSALRSWVIVYLSTNLGIQWRTNVMTHLLKLPVNFFEKRHIGDVISRFSSIEVIQHTLTTSFVEAILDGVMASITLFMMFLYSPGLATIAVAATILYGLGRWFWYRPLRLASEEQIIHAAKQASHFLETLRGIKTVQLFQRQELRKLSWLAILVDEVNAKIRSEKIQIYFKFANGVLFGTQTILVIALGAKMVLDGSFTIGVLTALLAYKTMFDTRVTSLIDKLNEFRMLQVQVERVSDILLAQPEIQPDFPLSLSDKAAPAIEVRGLRYRYGENEPYVLHDVSFRVEAGESLAISGPSGCGKSTLLNLLLGVLPFSEGDILIDGISVRQAGIDQVRNLIGVVLQDDALFAGSISDNISFFAVEPDQDRIEACARMAAIADDIEAMPMRYNSLVGDMGTILSGGQKQRILLARALYKQPRVLFLDEATSHLDSANESHVNQAISQLNITRIMVAHRKETLASADRVITLKDGCVVTENEVRCLSINHA